MSDTLILKLINLSKPYTSFGPFIPATKSRNCDADVYGRLAIMSLTGADIFVEFLVPHFSLNLDV